MPKSRAASLSVAPDAPGGSVVTFVLSGATYSAVEKQTGVTEYENSSSGSTMESAPASKRLAQMTLFHDALRPGVG